MIKVDMVKDLYERAMCLGYTSDSAASLADCFTDYGYGGADACPTHPNHSTVRDHNGYAVDMCEACHVIILSDGEGYYPGKWEATLAEREAEYVEIMERDITQAYAAGECACDLIMEMGAKRLPIGGRVCQVCGSVFTPEGTEASAEILAECDRIVAAKLGESTLSIEIMCDDDKCGTCDHCLMLAQVTESPKGFDEAMAEAERDDRLMADQARRAAEAVECNADESVRADERDNMTGVDMIRELLTIDL